MLHPPILLLHIIAGTLGMLSGFVAVSLLKGSRRHGLAGKVFVISMLCLSASGVYMAVMKSQPGNILGGALTFYLVATAWMTARRTDGDPGIFDWSALLVVLTVGAFEMTYGFEAATSQTGLKYGYPPGPYFSFGLVALLAAAGDVRMLVRGGITGIQRIARHLWRMCFALFIAAGSIFLARQQIFPALLRKAGLLFFLSFLPLILMIFWLVRVRFANAYKEKAIDRTSRDSALVYGETKKRARFDTRSSPEARSWSSNKVG
jgi:hypothetical protein